MNYKKSKIKKESLVVLKFGETFCFGGGRHLFNASKGNKVAVFNPIGVSADFTI